MSAITIDEAPENSRIRSSPSLVTITSPMVKRPSRRSGPAISSSISAKPTSGQM